MTFHKIEDRIRKLLRLADNNPEAEEAAAAFAQAQKLATKYALCIDDLDSVEDDPLRMPTVGDIVEEQLDGMRKLVYWKGVIAQAVAQATMCRVFKRGKLGLVILGEPKNIQIARYMYSAIVQQVDALGRDAISAARVCRPIRPIGARKFGRAFRVGCASSVAQRLRETSGRAIDEAASEAKALGSNALARIERAKAYVDASKAALDAKLEGERLRKASRVAPVESRAYQAGRFAGAKVRVSGSGAPELEGES